MGESEIAAALTAMGVAQGRASTWAPHLAAASRMFCINTPARLAAWLAQLAHESAGFGAVEERLDYTADRLAATWPRRFATPRDALPFAHQPQALANFVYAGRMGNGDAASGDGWRYRGRGLIQLTGRDNYAAAGGALGVDLEANPDLVKLPTHAANVAGWFWASRGCNPLADRNTSDAFASITRLINGGTTGFLDRCALWANARRALGVA